MLEVASDQLNVAATQVTNKFALLFYLLCLRGKMHLMLFKTGSDHTMISQRFSNQYQLNLIASKVQSVRLANSRTLVIIYKVTSFLIRLRELHESFSGPIMTGLNHNAIASINWMRHNRPYID